MYVEQLTNPWGRDPLGLLPPILEATMAQPLPTDIIEERLFVGTYPCGLVYADRATEEHGDYKRLALLNYSTLELSFQTNCPDFFKADILDDAQRLQSQKGHEYQISSSGQTITLGHGIE